MQNLSIAIITYNEERNLERCLESIQDIASEIVVVDSGSTDKTIEIAQRYHATVYHQSFLGHIEQKNLAMAKTTHPWVLSLDADEALDDQLKANIIKVLEAPDFQGYSMNRLNNYCGQWIRHGAWYPDKKLRLWNKSLGAWSGINPHDKVEMQPGTNIQHLKGNILHYSYMSIEEHQIRSKKYADIAAKAYQQRGKRAYFLQLLYKPPFKFLRDYIFKLGILDGYYGLVIALINSKEVYLKYLNLLRIQRDTPKKA
ncbi:MAG: glycosyltransferase family 2 protein [Chitinophagales bacterium]|nr:glycosyltransferase family 2 protein [Chitinophagales bacterium]